MLDLSLRCITGVEASFTRHRFSLILTDKPLNSLAVSQFVAQ
jgi:hypothetical protein